MKKIFLVMIFICLTQSQAQNEMVKFTPVQHASFVINYDGKTIFVDPDGTIEKWKSFPSPDLILVTHHHNDHCNIEIINGMKTDSTRIIGSKKSIEKIGMGEILANGESISLLGIKIEAVPAYNTTEEKQKFHPKGEGNGYILLINNDRIYVAGDTEDIHEMKTLKNIDHAFIPMNLPYTMSVEQAASAVLAFAPKRVYPYHYMNQNGTGDLEKFKKLVSVNDKIKVILLVWYGK